jgi:hypothetical protein
MYPCISADGKTLYFSARRNAVIDSEPYAEKIWVSKLLVDEQGKPVSAGNTRTGNKNQFTLAQNYPNPFNSEAVIKYDIPFRCMVNLTIYDVTGRKVKNLINRIHDPGNYNTRWNGKNESGKYVSSGIYFYCLQAGTGYIVNKMNFIK